MARPWSSQVYEFAQGLLRHVALVYLLLAMALMVMALALALMAMAASTSTTPVHTRTSVPLRASHRCANTDLSGLSLGSSWALL